MKGREKEQKLHRVSDRDRRNIALATSFNRRSRKWQQARVDAQFGPHACEHCRAEPCGSMWPDGACCHKCTHLPMPRWRLTHVLWYRKKPYYVMEVPVRRPGVPTEEEAAELDNDAKLPPEEDEQRWGTQRTARLGSLSDAVYYRWDGVSLWTRRARTHYFLGVRASPAEFMRALPNADELAQFAPRERPPHPFEEGITERPADELGEAFSDRTSHPPVEPSDDRSHYKKGLLFVEVEEADADRAGEADADRAEEERQDG